MAKAQYLCYGYLFPIQLFPK